jgi:DNA-binding NarL/FixJ family response regulator
MKQIKVLLADDHTIVRQGLRALLQAEPDIAVVGEAANGRQALDCARELRPDVVIMDIAMPSLNGLEATRQMKKTSPNSRVIILSSYASEEYVEQLVEAGASGYLLKQTAAQELVSAIKEARKGNAFFSPAISKMLLDQYQSSIEHSPLTRSPTRLSSRELEVLQLVAEGMANKGIAAALHVSVKTVEKHRQQLMNKLGIHDIAGLTRYAITKGVIESNQRPIEN